MKWRNISFPSFMPFSTLYHGRLVAYLSVSPGFAARFPLQQATQDAAGYFPDGGRLMAAVLIFPANLRQVGKVKSRSIATCRLQGIDLRVQIIHPSSGFSLLSTSGHIISKIFPSFGK
jgi:hypothetical protein